MLTYPFLCVFEVPFTAIKLNNSKSVMEACPVCLEDMDMLSFNDERDSTPTCYKLDCGHAYHTKCIIKTLSQFERKCPSCNGEKDPSTALTEKGIALELLAKVRKNDEVKIAANELRESIAEYKETLNRLKSDTKAYILQRSIELQVPQKRKYFMECLATVHRNVNAAAKSLNPKFTAAYNALSNDWRGRYYRGTTFERLFYGPGMAYTITRSKYPRLWFPLY